MPWDGSGNFTLSQNFPADRDFGLPNSLIDADKVDAEFKNIRDAIMNTLALDGQNAPSQNISWNSKRLTSLGDATALGDALNARAVVTAKLDWVGTFGGTANSLTATMPIAPVALVAGLTVRGIAALSNTDATGSVYLTLNGAAPVQIVGRDGNAIAAGHIQAGYPVNLLYDGTKFRLVSVVSTAEITAVERAKIAATIDPVETGAVGNGTTDDTAALQAAINAATALVGNMNLSSTIRQRVEIDLGGRTYKISNELNIAVADTNNRGGIIIRRGRLVADTATDWTGKYMMKLAHSNAIISEMVFDGNKDPDISCLLLNGNANYRIVRDSMFQFFGGIGIHSTGGNANHICDNHIGPQWNRGTDTEYGVRSAWTATGVRQDVNDSIWMNNIVFGCKIGMQFGSEIGTTTGGTNLLIGNHVWCAPLSGEVSRETINMLFYAYGNTCVGTYFDNGMIDLYHAGNSFYDNHWLIGNGQGVGAAVRLFATSVGQTAPSSDFYLEGGALPAHMFGGWTASTTTTNASNIITLSSGDAELINVGNRISGSGIPSNTYITEVLSSTSLRMSQNATASATVTATYIIPLMAFFDQGGSSWNAAIRSHTNTIGNSKFTNVYGAASQRIVRADTGNANGAVVNFARAGGPGARIGFIDDATANAPQIGSDGDELVMYSGAAGTERFRILDFVATRFELDGAGGPQLIIRDDAPEGVVSAPVGSLYLRKNGSTNTTMYRKESGTGNTGWIAVSNAGGGGGGGGDALTSGTLAQFAATTSAELAGVLNDETGFSTGAKAVFSISPALTGTPTAPTAAADTNTTQIATTAYVQAELTALLGGVSSANDTLAEIETNLGLKAPLASPALTGTPTAPTASQGNNSTQIATTAYVDAAMAAVATGVDYKDPVSAMTTGNIASLAGGAPDTVDAVSLTTGMRILVASQSSGAQNGIYTVTTVGTGSNGTWTRATDCDASAEVTTGLTTFVLGGTANGGKLMMLNTLGAITLGTTAITFTQVNSSTALGYTPVNKAGDTMSGALDMGSSKITSLQNGSASSDAAAFGQIPLAATATPLVDGVAAIGSGTRWAKEDHVHPTDTTRAALASPAFTGTVNISEALRFGGVISPAQLTANTHNWAPSGLSTATVIRIDTDANRSITGIDATGVSDGRILVLSFVGAANGCTLSNASASSTAANRFDLGADVIIAVGSSIMLRYDGTLSRWRAVGSPATISGVTGGTYPLANVTVDARGRVTNATNGLDVANEWLKQQYTAVDTLTDGATVNWDVSASQKAKVTLGGNRTMAAVTNAVEGATYTLWVIQDGTGSRTLSWTTTGAGSFDFGTTGAPTLTTTASKADVLSFEALSIGGTLKLRYLGIQKGYT